MSLPTDLINDFVKATRDQTPKKTESSVYGSIVEYDGSKWVRIDGSDRLTPIETTVNVKDNDRVIVTIKNHTATVTGNLTTPSATTKDVSDVANQISEFEILVAYKITATDLEAINATIESLRAEIAKIDNADILYADIDELYAKYAVLDKVTAKDVEILNAEIERLEVEIGKFTDISADSMEVIHAEIDNLKGYNADFTYVSADVLHALNAEIKRLDAEKISTGDLDAKYANIDFSNIGQLAMESFYARSGLIDNVKIGDATITGELVGVTIKGNLIQGGTVVADKLVIRGEDGLYYKLNSGIEGITQEQLKTEEFQNQLHGEAIIANSITAEKIDVHDLVAFDATIGGFKITESAIYSGVKESVGNTTQGIYMDKTGQMAIGDGSNFIKYYKDQNGNYKLEISAASIAMSSSGKTVETVVTELEKNAIVSTVEEFYQSTSPISLSGGSWSTNQPTWTSGTYIWRRTVVTYGDKSVKYTPSETGVCITGNTGAAGPAGSKGDKGDKGETGKTGSAGVGVSSISTEFYLSTSKEIQTNGSWVDVMPDWKLGTYLWSRSVITYTDGAIEYTAPVCDSSWEAVDNISIGARNLIRNSTNLLFDSYYFVRNILSISHDNAGTVTLETNEISFVNEGNGLISFIPDNVLVLTDHGDGHVELSRWVK